jgi:hypothetical protein
MNSRKLREQFQNIYKEFFLKQSEVISLPYLISWSWDGLPQFTWIHVKQKIPLRMYLWIKKIKENKIRFSGITYYDLSEDRFIDWNLLAYSPFFSQYEEYFNEEYKDMISEKWWIEISILSELSQWIGLGFSSISALLFVIWMERFYKGIWNLSDHTWTLNEIIKKNSEISWVLDKALKLKQMVGSSICIATQMASFFNSVYPIVSYANDDWGTKDEKASIHWYRLNELDKSLPKIPFIPLDYWIAYSWRPVILDNVVHNHKQASLWMDKVKLKLGELFEDEDVCSDKMNNFFAAFLDNYHDTVSETYRNMMAMISLEVFYNMMKMFSHEFSEHSLTDFTDSLDKARWWYYITQKASNVFKSFISDLIINFRHSSRVMWVIPNDTTIMWWTVTYIMPLESYRKQFSDSLQETKSKYLWSGLVYANWQDGTENIGFKVEQDLSKWIYWDYCSKNTFILAWQTWSSSYLWEYEELIKDRKKWIIIDTLSKKILIGGEKVTSDELPSQQTAVQILELLLANPDKDISNKELPSSSYSKNKNEMLGKIILPLLRIVKSKLGEDLPIICKWSLSDFYIKIWSTKTESSIFVLKKAS